LKIGPQHSSQLLSVCVVVTGHCRAGRT